VRLILKLGREFTCNLDFFSSYGVIIEMTKLCFSHGVFSKLFQTFSHIYFFVNPLRLS